MVQGLGRNSEYGSQIQAPVLGSEAGHKCLSKRDARGREAETLHNAKAVKDLQSHMDANVSFALKKAKMIKVKLEALDWSNTSNRSLTCGPSSSSDRTRTSVVNGLSKKLKDSMKSFNNLR
ncbi:hypothetical protein SO802_015450 [Lithocarpus litseifolius]|uniref:Syntaxin N-terminal domain-containing protein n=1 Tax=Lithocarpus litseifolius TaxID=425828 RepID=A0AAW2CV11_9ROSI